jgi:hypothetical protein
MLRGKEEGPRKLVDEIRPTTTSLPANKPDQYVVHLDRIESEVDEIIHKYSQ